MNLNLFRLALVAAVIYFGALVIAYAAEPACATYSPIPGAALDLSPYIKG